MKFLRKILFIPEKFDIICHNEKEWNNMQLFLFKRGYYWENSGKHLMNEYQWNYPRILKNYRTADIFGSKILIIESYEFVMKWKEQGFYKNVNPINAISYIRKIKLEKLK